MLVQGIEFIKPNKNCCKSSLLPVLHRLFFFFVARMAKRLQKFCHIAAVQLHRTGCVLETVFSISYLQLNYTVLNDSSKSSQSVSNEPDGSVCALNCAYIRSLVRDERLLKSLIVFTILCMLAASFFVFVAHDYFYLSSCLATDNNLHVYGMASATYVDNLISIMFIDDFE